MKEEKEKILFKNYSSFNDSNLNFLNINNESFFTENEEQNLTNSNNIIPAFGNIKHIINLKQSSNGIKVHIENNLKGKKYLENIKKNYFSSKLLKKKKINQIENNQQIKTEKNFSIEKPKLSLSLDRNYKYNPLSASYLVEKADLIKKKKILKDYLFEQKEKSFNNFEKIKEVDFLNKISKSKIVENQENEFIEKTIDRINKKNKKELSKSIEVKSNIDFQKKKYDYYSFISQKTNKKTELENFITNVDKYYSTVENQIKQVSTEKVVEKKNREKKILELNALIKQGALMNKRFSSLNNTTNDFDNEYYKLTTKNKMENDKTLVRNTSTYLKSIFVDDDNKISNFKNINSLLPINFFKEGKNSKNKNIDLNKYLKEEDCILKSNLI